MFVFKIFNFIFYLTKKKNYIITNNNVYYNSNFITKNNVKYKVNKKR